MSSEKDLADQIAEALRGHCTGSTMPVVAKEVAGLELPPPEGSKREWALAGLRGKSLRQLAEIARDLGRHFRDYALEESGLVALELGTPPITEITRRDVAKCFGSDLAGEQNPVDLCRCLFPIESMPDVLFGRDTLAQQISQHMVRNPGDWSVEYLFEQIGALHCSRDRFVRLIESALHPLSVRGKEQEELATKISAVLTRDRYCIGPAGEESGYPLFAINALDRGVTGAAKNLVFASNGPKPEIGFSDAINNDIVILSNENSCLVYDRPIRKHGLLWSELVKWWGELNSLDDTGAARNLGQRLLASLASDGERNMFEMYFKLYKKQFNDALPALIPQVYLHYDPAIAKTLRRRAALRRQRMDFLMLLPNSQRIVLEIDGSQHFSREGAASLQLYSEMISADRDLRLAGYEIFRFGANEVVGPNAAVLIKHFFDRLWAVHPLAS